MPQIFEHFADVIEQHGEGHASEADNYYTRMMTTAASLASLRGVVEGETGEPQQ